MAKRYKCMYCDKVFERAKLIQHIDKAHQDMIPEGYSGARLVFDKLNNNTVGHGACRVCGSPTKWDERINRYSVLCDNPACRQKMREEYKKNMLRVRGTYNILNDPEQQKIMLQHRKISGQYKHSDGGVIAYTGSYEKAFLEFIDNVMQIPSKDIISPGPTMEYVYQGRKHIYIPDFYYLPYNIIIEIKDGGDNVNTQHSIGRDASREKTIEKERLITDKGEYNYIRLTNNQFVQFLELIMSIKEKVMNGDESKTIRINESSLDFYTEEYILEENLSDEIKDIKTPEQLLDWVKKNIKYDHNYKFNTPEEVLKSHSGDCHDQAFLLNRILKSLGYEVGRIFVVEFKEWGKPGGATHTVCWYKEDNKYKWIETAWGGFTGIHGPFNTLEELKEYVKKHWNWSGENDKLYMTSTKVKPPMSFENYVVRNTPQNDPKSIFKK